ncbi:hypothetical protein [Kribbella swartbergensis]
MTAYVPAGVFRRTDAERRDQGLAWNRPDQAFFAAGACHILAWPFLETYPDAGFQIVALRKIGDEHPSHVIATDNHRAFDHAGWTPLEELLRTTESFEGTQLERLPITEPLHDFCKTHNHRPPEAFYSDPRPRARTYLNQFPPPTTS